MEDRLKPIGAGIALCYEVCYHSNQNFDDRNVHRHGCDAYRGDWTTEELGRTGLASVRLDWICALDGWETMGSNMVQQTGGQGDHSNHTIDRQRHYVLGHDATTEGLRKTGQVNNSRRLGLMKGACNFDGTLGS